ncbi:branched-chain amino acid ABC transporter permease [Paraburkholderia lycopersici]|uniref:Amino acid/amide ABC transporter membrane protein 1, HAAT family n=1 Tax=Paraburkholderia lycopersici TaxID=416944 RepID=A0A1G6YS61_9BURK|nr:branched-chain amino acid ABC transporter permease [Paraburkholderia lycopersici]SDD93141.1 amino acid/amide ABC transporter membrane protein 1, HAAT family [Paraburkholderia lycopersici]
MEFLTISLLNGISYGLLLFMLSSGLTLIFSMMGVLNFAHASFYMLGAYFAYTIASRIGFWPALVAAPLLVACVGALVERFGLRTVHKFGHVAELLFTFGLSYLIVEGVKLVWGLAAVPYAIPPELNGALFKVFTSDFPKYRAFMMLISISMLAALYLVLTRTRIGLVIQASLTHPEMVEALGHNVQRVFMLVFGAGAALAGLAGVIGGNAFVTSPSMAESVGTIVFVVAVVGGMCSLPGAFIASLLIGIMQTFAVTMDASLSDLFSLVGVTVTDGTTLSSLWRMPLSQVAPILPYLLMVLMMILRPRGLLGKREG